MSNSQEVQEEKLRSLAYKLWDEAGRPLGREDEFWQMAEERLNKEKLDVPNDDLDIAGEHSFPASDPINHT